jgi:hypothetical protein
MILSSESEGSTPLEPNSIIILSLDTPKEKLWGTLVSMNSAGVTVRAIDLNSFDDFIPEVLDPDLNLTKTDQGGHHGNQRRLARPVLRRF